MTHHHHYHVIEGNNPPLLLLHGTGADEFDLIPLAQDIAPGSAIFSVRGNVSENGQNRYFKRTAEGVFDHEDLIRRTHELAKFIAETAPQHGMDPAQMIALGFSNGANIASSLFFLHPELLAGGILLRGMVPFMPTQTPDLASKKILLLSGIMDPIIPMDNARKLASIYQAGQADIIHTTFPTGHGLTQNDVLEAKQWFLNLVQE